MKPPLFLLTGVLFGVYGIAMLLMAHWWRGAFVPGASDNASGTAAVLALAEARLRAPQEDVEVILLLTGCEECGLIGAAAFRDRLREEKNAPPAIFLNLDGLGCGPPRFLGQEQPLVGPSRRYPSDLLALAAREAAEAGLRSAGPSDVFALTDGLVFLTAGMRGLTLFGSQDDGYLPHYHQMSDTAENVDFDSACIGVRFAIRLLRRLALGEVGDQAAA